MFISNRAIAVFIRSNKAFFIIALLAGIIGSMCTILISLSIGSFYQLIFHSDGNKSRILALLGFHAAKSIKYALALYAGLLLIKSGADWLFYYLSKVSANNLSRFIRDRLFEHQLNTRYDVFSRKSPARYLLSYSGDSQAIQNFYVKGILSFTKDIALLFAGFYFLFKINLVLSFIFLTAVPLLFISNYLLNIPIRVLIKEKNARKNDMLSFVSHCFHAILSVKAFRKEKIEVTRFHKKSEKLYNTTASYFFHYAFVQSLAPLLLYTVLGIVLFLVACHQVDITHGDLTAFVLLGMLQLSALRRVVKVETIWRTGTISTQKINNLFKATTETSNPGSFILPIHSLKFENINLDGTASNGSLINIQINQGTINYISGRSSERLIRIVLGLEKLNKSDILMNNVPINKFTDSELRNTFSISSDYLPLYGKNLYEMITRGKKPGRKDIIEKILHNIGWDLTDFALTLQAPIEKSGTVYSFQERKLISLARALLVKTPVLILDNPFDGVNGEIILKCTNYLKSLLPGKTIIIITNINKVSTNKPEEINGYINNLN